ncbi:Ankyrin repeat-containing protein ITN1 [Cardamine amara subsp. amara]|uniref:Ankyrin repeat-containing protein ITN1 n=1 Tax=Cardamine amara subsp. amara TaxID=228776 RepID=A0ABD1ANF7_CARAN
MSNLESHTKYEAATMGSQSEILENLENGKHARQEDTWVDIARPLRYARDQISCDDRQRDKYLTIGVPLYQAAMKGDWKAAKAIIDHQEDIVTATITNNLEIALHIAVATKHKGFVRHLVRRMNSDDLALQNRHGNTALGFAAASGIIEIAEMLIDKNPNLPMIRGGGEMTPIHVAALFGHGEMVKYLYKKTDFSKLSHLEFINLFLSIISADIYDVALRMLKDKEELATSRSCTGETALHLMARKPFAIAHKKQLNLFQSAVNSIFKELFRGAQMQTFAHQLVEELWKSVVQLPVRKLSEFLGSPSRLLFDAAESGNVEFLVILIRSYPDLIWKVDDKNRSLFHVAALNRHESIFDIIYELGAIKDLIVAYKEDTSKNNLLHLVAHLAPPNRLQVVSGAALQMQREILWFKAVEKIVPRSYIKAINIDGEVAHDLFTKEHNKLRKEGERWMKETATSCMLVATLIATVVFASAFTVPGGSEEATGFPKFRKKFWFDMFILSNSVALFSSIISVVIFLSILTSRYAEDDFRTKLPSKLMFGLLALFVSIISMVLAFTATMILIRYEEPKYSLLLIVCLASLTALSFVTLHIHLWFDTLRSCLFKFLFQRRKSGMFA